MSFSPQLFLSNIKAHDGPAKPSRFEVILPIPSYINSFVGNSVLEQLINLPKILHPFACFAPTLTLPFSLSDVFVTSS